MSGASSHPSEIVAEPMFVPTTDELARGPGGDRRDVLDPAPQQGADPRHRADLATGPAPHARSRGRDRRSSTGRRADQADVPSRGARPASVPTSRAAATTACRSRSPAATGIANSLELRRVGDLARSASAARCSPPRIRCRSTPSSRSRSSRPAAPRRSRSRGASRITCPSGGSGSALRQPRRRRRAPAARADPPAARVVTAARGAPRVAPSPPRALEPRTTAIAVGAALHSAAHRRRSAPSGCSPSGPSSSARRSRRARAPTASPIACSWIEVATSAWLHELNLLKRAAPRGPDRAPRRAAPVRRAPVQARRPQPPRATKIPAPARAPPPPLPPGAPATGARARADRPRGPECR